jgi:hypothetical protein
MDRAAPSAEEKMGAAMDNAHKARDQEQAGGLQVHHSAHGNRRR